MHRTLIVAKLQEARDLAGITRAFEDSDSSDLPHMVGVTRRTLFSFHDLYFHLVEADGDITDNLYKARGHPLYHSVSDRLTSFVAPYDPAWREPKDAMARPFYVWTPDRGREL